ncbi:MAG: putative sulfate exporter family transporter [Litorimonas sp.]
MPDALPTLMSKVVEASGRLGAIWPGILLAVVIAIAAQALATKYGAPAMPLALLIGAAFHYLAAEPRTSAGVAFSASTLLRVGVALLGLRLSWEDIASLGWAPAMATSVLVCATIALGAGLALLTRRDAMFGLLAGGSVAICGASAAVALSLVLPRARVPERDVLFVVVGITTLSTVAMVVYPILFAWLGYSEVRSGFLIGATIHDVAQVVGAGYSVSETAGETAVFVKLQRVLMLPIVLLVIGLAFRGRAGSGWGVPPFLVAFVLLMAAGNLLPLSSNLHAAADALSSGLLLTAIAALGVKTSPSAASEVGLGAAAILVILTLALLAGALVLHPLAIADG